MCCSMFIITVKKDGYNYKYILDEKLMKTELFLDELDKGTDKQKRL